MNGILVGYDGSGHSLRALEWAAREAAVRRASLTVLSVCQAAPDRWRQATADGPGDRGLEETRTLAEEVVGKALAQADADLPQPRVTIRAIKGVPAEELLNAAAGADMVVVGSRGTGGFSKLLLGSVSSHLTHHARCPVVVIPDDDI
jgi:nucleotide-binding universal stress UspA family protein